MAAELVVWKGDALLKFCDAAIDHALAVAAITLQAEARKLASVPNTGVRVPVRRRTKGGNKRSRTIYPHSAKHGEAPRRRTGRGQKGIVFGRIGPREYRVGFSANVRYMFFHEVGIDYAKVGFQRRPSVVPAMERARTKMAQAAIRAAQGYRRPT